jgi:hypothetical protein
VREPAPRWAGAATASRQRPSVLLLPTASSDVGAGSEARSVAFTTRTCHTARDIWAVGWRQCRGARRVGWSCVHSLPPSPHCGNGTAAQIDQVVELFAPFGGVVASQALGKNRSNLKVRPRP